MAEDQVIVARRPLWQRILKGIGLTLVGLIVLAGLLVLGLNTAPGKRVIANYLGGYKTASGLTIKVGRIEGSLYGQMVLSDVRVSDPQGVFLTSPRIAVDWRPFAYLSDHIDVRSAQAALMTMTRSPAFTPTPSDPNAPILPDLDVDIGRLSIQRFVLAKAVSGQAHILSIDGATHIADKRAQVSASVAALKGAGVAGGDRLTLKLDAVPDRNTLDVAARVTAPADGVVATLGGLKAPLDFSVGGAGTWKAWNGKASGTLDGSSLADLTIAANSGTFKVRGTLNPGLYPGGAPKDKATPVNPIARLTAPALQVAVDATLDQRKVNLTTTLRSDALALDAKGLLDFAASSFGQFAINARLLTPGAIAPNLNGRDVAARVVLDGKFATPTVNYVVTAAVLGFGETRVDQLYASGLARVNADHILIPLQARAARVSGISAAAGGLLDTVAINGDFAIARGKVLSDNLRIRSRKIDATAVVVADLATGMYRGALNGRVNDYTVAGFGIVSLRTDAKLVTLAKGFGVTAHVAARTSRIFNDGARAFLGGNAALSADVGYDPDGIVTFRNLHLAAPQFHVLRGQGRYDPKGPLLVDADAYSNQYGPLTARVSGTATRPVVLLRAARPGVGVGLVNLEAQVRGNGTSYAVLAKGGTNYGPFSADLLVTPARQLTVDIHDARFAGVDFKGRVQQLAAGPFGGRVAFAGSGISGAALLGGGGTVQRVDLAARANNAKIPGVTDFTIGRAIVNAQAVLYPNAPQIVADAQVADLRYGAAVLSAARVKVNYVKGSGTAQLLASGSNGVPFRIAANAQLAPRLWLIATQGAANGITFKTANPAHIDIDRGTYRLQPTRIDFGAGALTNGGSARVAGEYGAGLSARLRLDALDLSVANAIVPDLGLGGSATGSLDYTQPHGASVPQIAGQFSVKNFTRSSLVSVSEPVDLIAQIGLTNAGGDARALIRRGGTTVGRLVATLQPLGAGASWTQRLLAAPLSGGIRYNGPSGVLFSFAGLARQQLSGPIALAADFGGRVDAPRLNGLIRADSLTYDNETYGTRLTRMKIAGRFTNDRFELTQLSARAGDGTVQAQGTVGLSAAAGFPIDVHATLANARLAASDALGATATGTIAVTSSKADGGLIKGDIRIPNARYEIIRQGQAEVAELTGVRRKSDLVKTTTQAPPPAPVGLFKLDLRVHADNQLFVSGMGLESEWQADMHVGGTSLAPVVSGNLEIVRGTFTFNGKKFDVTKGQVTFDGGPLSDPAINISATATTTDVDVTITITGTGSRPQIAFASTPALPQDEVLSRLLFGSSVTNLSAIQAIQLAAALNSLRGSGGGLNPLGKLRSVAGIDRLRLLGADSTTGQGTALAAGKYITKNIYVEIITDARGFTATQLEVSLTKALSVLSQAGSFGGSNLTVRYKKDF